MARKRTVAILFGGKSAEHEISLKSARNIAEAIDRKRYDIVYVGIDTAGHWLSPRASAALIGETSVPIRAADAMAFVPAGRGAFADARGTQPLKIDVVFPVLHGPLGEDGTVQGLLKLADVPFVGADVLGSAVGMDKDVMKRLLRDAGIPIADFLTLRSPDDITFAEAKRTLGLPLFVKPANLGSSVGVAKVYREAEYRAAVAEAFRFDTKVLVEEYIDGREIECAVLGNETPIASVPGEIVVHHDFYSYEAKYLDENGASLQIPAKLPKTVARRVQELSLATFRALECSGMGRVDSFVTKSGTVFVNEINTIPGFTNSSMYPKLWEASGLPYNKLIDRLMVLAIERHKKLRALRTKR